MARRGVKQALRANFTQRLIVMAKSPVAGRVKRRLAREIGDVAAIRFYRNCLAHTVLRLARDSRWRTLLAVSPDKDVAGRFWPSRKALTRVPQGEGDLGRRMQRLLDRLPPGPAIIVGGDIPAIRPVHVAAAFRLLGRADAVFGPASDGGFWLVGLNRRPRVLSPFAGVRWSGPHALADTLANLKGKRVAFAAHLNDLDTEKDLRRERARLERLIPGAQGR